MIATSGRPTLTTTLAALTPQLQSGDEILVERLDCPWGHQARNNAIPRCAGKPLAHSVNRQPKPRHLLRDQRIPRRGAVFSFIPMARVARTAIKSRGAVARSDPT